MKRTVLNRHRQRGVALVTAIFLLVALAGLAVAVVTLSTSQHDASAQDLQGQRAYQAAKAGIEWALITGLQPVAAPQPATAFGCAPSNTPRTFNVAMPANTTLSSFTVTVQVSCDADVAGIAGGGANDPTAGHVQIVSTACNQPTNGACPGTAQTTDYVQRRMIAQL